MSISAINCTPIKPNVSFGKSEEEKFDEISSYSDKINDQFVKSSDIKKPAAVAASVAIAALTVYAGAKGITSLVTSKIAPKAGETVEKYLQTGANTVKAKAESLSNAGVDESLTTVKKYAGKALGAIENGARNLYKAVAYSGIPKEVTNPERANKALSNGIGTGAAAATIADICTVDSNSDGISDIMQKSQNVYTGAKTSYGSAFEVVNVLSDIAQVLA